MAAAVTGLLTDLLKTGAGLLQLKAVGDAYASIDFTILLLCHTIIVARWTKGQHGSSLFNFIIGFFTAFGGGIASSYVLMAPKAVNPLVASNAIAGLWTLSWWLTNYCPGDPLGKLLDLKPVSAACAACLQILRASLVADRIDISENRYPGIVAAALVAGTLAASGGKIINDLFCGALGKHKGHSEIEHPTYILRSSIFAAVTYYITVVYLHALTAAEGKALIVTLFVVQQLAADLLDYNFDYTEAPFELFALITRMAPGGATKRTTRASAASTPARSRATRAKPASKPTTPRGGQSGDESEGGRGGRTPRRRSAKSD